MNREGSRFLNLQLDDGGPFLLWQDDEHIKPRHGMLLWTLICDNPECECRQVQIRAMAVDDRLKEMRIKGDKLTFRLSETVAADLPMPEKRLSAVVDVDTGEASLAQEAPENERDFQMLGLLKEKMKGNLFETVRRRWRAVKKPRDREQRRGQDWSWWEPGVLVSWTEAFPDDFNFLLEYRGATFWANDMYCINPGCPCQTVLIAFCQVHGKSRTEEMGTVAIHLRNWQIESIDPKIGDQKKLLSLWELLRKRPGLKLTLQERQRDLRAIGREIIREGPGKEMEKPFPKPKVGRNDPCPCGSGKKYKKCSLNKSL